MKHLITCFVFSFCSFVSFGQIDGPYVFYRNDQVIVQKILSGNVSMDSFPEADKTSHNINIAVDGHSGWSFTVSLKRNLVSNNSIVSGGRKTLFLSDIEGEFAAFHDLLIANKVIDEKYNWTFGNGRLVIAGDLFDRGKQVTQYLWLLYKLEDEAALKGGAVEVVLGNHDIMNLSGDFRYVDSMYFSNAAMLGHYYADLYGRNTELGRWLRSKNIIEKIGDVLVLHGGLSPAVVASAWSLQRINTSCRPFFDAGRKNIPDSLKPFFGKEAPFWYRGYFLEPKTTMAGIDSTLLLYDCKKIVVGHTIVDRNIAMYYKGKVIGIDVDEHKGNRFGLLLQNGKYYIVDDKGNRNLLLYKEGNDDIKESQVL